MKVRVVLTIAVDPEAWEVTYGEEGPQIRDSVKNYAANSVYYSAAANEGAITGVEVK